jgi:UDP-2-acetamido-3-amino-2,3-dideoxy-glucuronate N-acetyltransferase
MKQAFVPKIACIGAGYWGKNLLRNFNDLNALAGVCDYDPAVKEKFRGMYPGIRFTRAVEDVFADSEVNGVAIATPAETHRDLVRGALMAGKDVFVEKPLSLSVEDGKELVALAAEKNRILMVGHLLWYHAAILKLQTMVENGDLGRIQYIYSNRLNLGKIRREENILWSFAPHDVSVVLGLLGEMPDKVSAQGGNYLHDRIADVTVSLLSFPSGVRAHLFVSWLHPFKEQRLIVVGDQKMAVFDDLETENKLVIYPHSIQWRNGSPVATKADAHPVAFPPDEPLRNECQHFLECVTERRTPRTDGHEGLRVLQVLQQCQSVLERSASPGKEIYLVRRKPESFVHESAFVDEDVQIGAGTTVWHVAHILRNSQIGENCRIGQNVVIGPNVRVGNGVKIQNNVSVYEGVTLEDDVFCGPSAVFTNVINPRSEIRRMDELRPTLVRRGATLGANCTIVCGITIGQYAFVGAGAVAVRDVPDFALMVGNPARIIGWMCKCGHRIEFDAENGSGTCRSCQRRFRKIGRSVSEVSEFQVVA